MRGLDMANQEYIEILRQGINVWNQWKDKYRHEKIDLIGANLRRADLRGAKFNMTDLSGADLREADLREAKFNRADLSGADLSRANLRDCELSQANLNKADLFQAYLDRTKLTEACLNGASLFQASLTVASLSEAQLNGARLNWANLTGTTFFEADLSHASLYRAKLINTNLCGTNFSGADLSEADLSGATLLKTNFTGANLTYCRVYGISAWDVQLDEAIQNSLIITSEEEEQSAITVDNLEIAQFVYLLLNNKNIRSVIDTITSKVVLILGRFIPKRKVILDAVREELRKRNYLPILFDFDKPASRDLTETISILAHLARFIIVDLTDPSSTPHEVATVIPQTVVPVQPLLALQPLFVDGKAVERHEYAMFEDLRRRYHWVLPTFRYQDTADLLASLQEHIIEPAEMKAQELVKR
jgi:uncharacterized protein YjbI with pentapeptide repeats